MKHPSGQQRVLNISYFDFKFLTTSDKGEEGVMDSEANNEEKKSDEWVEDPDSDIMDAKVSF